VSHRAIKRSSGHWPSGISDINSRGNDLGARSHGRIKMKMPTDSRYGNLKTDFPQTMVDTIWRDVPLCLVHRSHPESNYSHANGTRSLGKSPSHRKTAQQRWKVTFEEQKKRHGHILPVNVLGELLSSMSSAAQVCKQHTYTDAFKHLQPQ